MNASITSKLLNTLDQFPSLSGKIKHLHQVVNLSYPFIHRISVAIYDKESDSLKTYVDSADDDSPLVNYQAKLKESSSLQRIAANREPRIINNLLLLKGSHSRHTQQILSNGYQSSYTVPLHHGNQLVGFLFFNSRTPQAFGNSNMECLEMAVSIISMVIIADFLQAATIRGILSSAVSFSHHRDPETGAHLERMSRFARIIASELMPKFGYDDEFIENIFRVAPLHDIGKIAIPDSILLKQGPLTEEESRVMRTHATKGQEIIFNMLGHFNLSNVPFGKMLGNVVGCHHECMDGSGYPEGLRGEQIPLEARIVAVADAFDALTSVRPYKRAWSNEDAYRELVSNAGRKFDADCVSALLKNTSLIERLQEQFKDEPDKVAERAQG